MKRLNSLAFVIVTILAAAIFPVRGFARPTQESTATPKASAVVKPQIYVSLDPAVRGKDFQVAVVVEIARGYHMNSHYPSDAYLIPTTLTAQLPAGFQLLDTIYPDGRAQKFSFSPDKPLDVYSGSVTLKLKLLVQTSAPIGATAIPMILRYQACNDSTCLPPVKLPVEAKVIVGSADSKTRLVHPEIFAPPASSK